MLVGRAVLSDHAQLRDFHRIRKVEREWRTRIAALRRTEKRGGGSSLDWLGVSRVIMACCLAEKW